MIRIDPPAEHLVWLENGEGDLWRGYLMRDGWPAAVWLLHGMFVKSGDGQGRRALWRELATERNREAPESTDGHPFARRWGFDPFEDRFHEPIHKGSLDVASWDGLLDALKAERCTRCLVFLGSWQTDDWMAAGEFWSGDIADLTAWVGRSDDDGTPSNIWAADRSWFVSTDVDGLATFVGGSNQLIERLTQHPDVETVAEHAAADGA